MRRISTFVAGWILAAAPAFAEVPKGCEPVLTVQKHSCALMNFYKCDGTGETGAYSEEYTKDGRGASVYTTGDFEFIKDVETESGGGIYGVPGKGDMFSLSALLAQGEDRVDRFITMRGGFIPQKELRFVGVYSLTGDTKTIDRTVLKTGRVVADIVVGPLFGAFHVGTEIFVSERDGLYIEGARTIRAGDGGPVETTNETPVHLIRPGEEGFMSRVPLYDCDDLVSQRDIVGRAQG
jgi:hypothetical protein